MLLMKCKETAVYPPTFLLKHTHSNVYASIAQSSDAAPFYLVEDIYTSNHNALHSLAHDKVGAWRGLAIMGTGFEAYIHRGLGQQSLVGLAHRSKSVYLGMGLTTTAMPSLADNTVTTHYHRPNHRIGTGMSHAIGSQLQTAPHIFLVSFYTHNAQSYHFYMRKRTITM